MRFRAQIAPKHSFELVVDELLDGFTNATVAVYPSPPIESYIPFKVNSCQEPSLIQALTPLPFKSSKKPSLKAVAQFWTSLSHARAFDSYSIYDPADAKQLVEQIRIDLSNTKDRLWYMTGISVLATIENGALIEAGITAMFERAMPSDARLLMTPGPTDYLALHNRKVAPLAVQYPKIKALRNFRQSAMQGIEKYADANNIRQLEGSPALWSLVLDDVAYGWVLVPMEIVFGGYLDGDAKASWRSTIFRIHKESTAFESCVQYYEHVWHGANAVHDPKKTYDALLRGMLGLNLPERRHLRDQKAED